LIPCQEKTVDRNNEALLRDRHNRRSAEIRPAKLGDAGAPAQFSEDKKPIVVWNSTRRCNLTGIHCYADSENKGYPNELTTAEAQAMIRDLAEFEVPVLLFSGGEPFIRADMYENATLAKELGMRTVISTNGTLITENAARRIKDTGSGTSA